MSKKKPAKITENGSEKTEADKAKSQELIPAYRDTFVHFLFGTPGNEPILLHFLNAMLESDKQPFAKAVEMRNPFNPATFVTAKYTILDVRATGERGDIFIVEFQTSERATFADRMTYYGCRAFGTQMIEGDPYTSLRAVVAIAVTSFEMFRQLESIHNTFVLTAKANPKVVFTHLVQMHVLEATPEKIDRVSLLPSALGAWTNFFFYSHLKSEDEMSTLLQDHPVIQQAYGKYQQFNQDEKLRALDEAHQRYLHDHATDMEAAHGKGKVEGRVTEKINDIQKLLRFRFNPVPDEIVNDLNGRTDLIALDSLFEVAYQCQSLDEFSEALK